MSDLIDRLREADRRWSTHPLEWGDMEEAACRIESLQRENAALRDVLDKRGNLSKYVDSGNLLVEQEAAAITPEMRVRIERKLADMQAESPLPIGGELVDLLRDLLGEQG